ncbi:hypothetical protein [Streptomyces sp. NPDC050485]|uniref:hypothetical protein n=1 Tax=Streptomyces sp. NPDC050485 TaxID=3365617 RepID=UPI003798B1BB
MKIRTAAGLAGATLASAVAGIMLAAPAHADTARGVASLGSCQIFLSSARAGGHDYVRYNAISWGQWGCTVFLRTWVGPNHYDHDGASVAPYGGASSSWYYDAGVKTQACIQMSSVDINCTVTY